MESYDDRPISVYDNLSMPTTTATTTHATTNNSNNNNCTPQVKTSSTSAAGTAANGAATSPYSDISFKFNDDSKTHLQQQHSILPNGSSSININRNLNPSNQSHLQTPLHQVQQNNIPTTAKTIPLYATPLKTAALPTIATTTPTTSSSPPPPPQASTTIFIPNAFTAMTSSPVQNQRPLSQHSQSELYEASQSIAAVKAALNDAKSKFFGINGYAQDQQHNYQQPQTHKFQLPDCETAPTKSKVQILTPPPKPPQPKYQNIPENSAIFRNNTPPERPPKPNFNPNSNLQNTTTTGDYNNTSTSPLILSGSPTTPSVESGRLSITPERGSPHSGMSSPTPTAITPQSTARISPYTAQYKQIPLNDIDCTSSSQPSQAVYMSTTVPQNIKGSKIAGRHTPTRNSLRHSRMLVLSNKNYQGMDHPNPMNFKYPNLARSLLILQINIGILLCFLAIWIGFLAPNTALQENPYWSGLTLLFTGILGLVLVRYQRIKRHKVRENCFIFLRADSYMLSLLAVVLCCVALICASIHFARITATDTKCEPTNPLLEHGSCSCTFNAPAEPNTAQNFGVSPAEGNEFLEEDQEAEIEDHSYKVEYRDLSCMEVTGEWTYVLAFSIALNAIGFIVSIFYIVLLACYRHNSKRIYASVHTSTF